MHSWFPLALTCGDNPLASSYASNMNGEKDVLGSCEGQRVKVSQTHHTVPIPSANNMSSPGPHRHSYRVPATLGNIVGSSDFGKFHSFYAVIGAPNEKQ